MSPQCSALVKPPDETALMPPPRKRIKRPATVLDEDVYADAVSHIIARDFFPGLLETEAQNEYLSALESKDRNRIPEAGRNLTQVMTPRQDGQRGSRGTNFTPRRATQADQTPITNFGATPMTADGSTVDRSYRTVDVNMSLGAFQSKYTSEDNESFNELLDKQNQRKATKYAHFFHGNRFPSARQLEYQHHKQIEDNKRGSMALVVQNSDGHTRQLLAPGRPSQDLDLRQANLDGFRSRQGPRNHFMFEPESLEDTITTSAEAASQASAAPPKAVVYGATRFSEPDLERPPSPTMSTVDRAIARRAPPSSAGYSGAETPRVNGYAFVDAEPTPSELGIAVTDEEVDQQQRAAFDKLLPKAQAGDRNPFSISEQSKREDIHHRLVEKGDAGRRKGSRLSDLRRLGITPGRTPTPSFATAPKRNAGQMTPAAKLLAARIATPRKGW